MAQRCSLKKLQEYKKTKLALVNQLRTLSNVFNALKLQKAENDCKDLMLKITEDQFVLAILGQFKRGKSSLMNALVESDILPVGVLPLTSVITKLKYGPEGKIKISRENWSFEESIDKDLLLNFITEAGNPSNEKKIQDVCLELPAQILRSGVIFVDTPGVGSVIKNNTKTTYEFLPKCDAVIFMTSVECPLSKTEVEFLLDIKQHVSKFFFVVNKMDLVNEAEKKTILEFVKRTLSSILAEKEVEVFQVSVNKKMGIFELETAIAAFLQEERQLVFMENIFQKTRNLINFAFKETYIGDDKNIKDLSMFENLYSDPDKVNMILKNVQRRINDLAESKEAKKVECKDESKEAIMFLDQLTPQNLYPQEYDKIHSEGGCLICEHTVKVVWDIFTKWQYEIASTELARREYAEKIGLCAEHTWQFLSVCSPYGVSVGYLEVGRKLIEDLRKIAKSGVDNRNRGVLHGTDNCYICKIINKIEEEHSKILARYINEAQDDQYKQLANELCLKHLWMILEFINTDEKKSALQEAAADFFEEVTDDMETYAMKHEVLRRNLQNENEKNGYLKFITHMVGEKRRYWM